MYLKNKIDTIKHAYLTSTWKLKFLNFFNDEKNIKIKFKNQNCVLGNKEK